MEKVSAHAIRKNIPGKHKDIFYTERFFAAFSLKSGLAKARDPAQPPHQYIENRKTKCNFHRE